MGGVLPDIVPDCFDIEGAKKHFDELKSKAKENLSIDPKKIADAVGSLDLGEKFDKFKSCKEIITNIADNDLREKVINVVTEIRKKQLDGDNSKSASQENTRKLTSTVTKTAAKSSDNSGMMDQMNGVLKSHSEASNMFKDLVGGGKSSSESSDTDDQIKIETGQMTESQYLDQQQSKWAKDNIDKGKPIVPVGVGDGEQRPNLGYGGATNRPKTEERDEQYAVLITPNKTGIYVNEETAEDPGSVYIVYQGKHTSIRINAEGIHISSDQSFNQRICVNSNVLIDGQSRITVTGGKYDIYVKGQINLYSTDNINITSEKNINLTAKQNINMQSMSSITEQASSDITLRADGEIKSHSNGKFSIDTAADFESKAGGSTHIQGGGALNIKSGGSVNIDGSSTFLQSGKAEDASPSVADKVAIDSANPITVTVPLI